MSRIGNLPCPIPEGVLVEKTDNKILVKGPFGQLHLFLPNEGQIDVVIEKNQVIVTRNKEDKKSKSLHGLFRSLINNHIFGVSKLFNITLELVGIGYRASCVSQRLELNLGYSHNIVCELPPEIKFEVKVEKGSNPLIILSSADKQLLGMISAFIKSLRSVEPYKGKGFRIFGETVIIKAGKKA
jgi:large subunit ribosomal protein L6